MAKTVCRLLGIVLLLVGIVGFVSHDLLGAHFNFAHNIVHVVSGALALYFGFVASSAAARTFCLAFGTVYLLLGLVGYFLGTTDERLFRVGEILTLGKVDHFIHVGVGVLFLIGGLLGKGDR